MNIDYLKKNIVDEYDQREKGVGSPLQPYYHGLGCIRLCMKDKTFINFYSNKYIKATAKYVHTHRENFTSEAIRGSYDNILYDIKPVNEPADYREEWVECWTDGNNFTIHENVEVIEMARKTLNQGETMFHSYNDYHDLELNTEHAITKVTFDFSWPYPEKYRGKIYPKIVRPNDDEFVGAANAYGDPDKNWEIIREILNETEDY